MNWKVIIDEGGYHGISQFVWYWNGLQPSCEVIDDGEDIFLPELEVSHSVTKAITILSKGHSGIPVICTGQD